MSTKQMKTLAINDSVYEVVDEYARNNINNNGGAVNAGTGEYSEIFNDYENNKALGDYSHSEGRMTKAVGRGSHSEGDSTIAGNPTATLSNDISELSTYEQQVPGAAAHTEGIGSIANKSASHAEGFKTQALGEASHSEGQNTTASSKGAHAEGLDTIAEGDYSHAEGCSNGNIMTTASGKGSHAEGIGNWAIGKGSHAEGINNSASRDYSHAEGDSTTASGTASHTEGKGTIASSSFQHAQGKYNVEDSANKYAHIVGGGTSDLNRKNIHTIDWYGNAEFSGDVVSGNVSLLGLGNKINAKYNLKGITLEDVTKDRYYINTYIGYEGALERQMSEGDLIGHCTFTTRVKKGDSIMFTNAHVLTSESPYMFVAPDNNSAFQVEFDSIFSSVNFNTNNQNINLSEYIFEYDCDIYISFNYTTVQAEEFFYIKSRSSNEPLILYADTDNPNINNGDEALAAIASGRQILIRINNADSGNYTAVYSPVYQYQLPNYQNNYLYLFYIKSEMIDITNIVGFPLHIPTYGELQLELSNTYNQTPLL